MDRAELPSRGSQKVNGLSLAAGGDLAGKCLSKMVSVILGRSYHTDVQVFRGNCPALVVGVSVVIKLWRVGVYELA